ncbi:hypothetical protein, partial [Roseomonas indoligenes]
MMVLVDMPAERAVIVAGLVSTFVGLGAPTADYLYAAGDGRLVRWWRGVDFCGSDAGQLVNDWSCDDRRTDRNG